jgi:hypothetical protein
MFLTSKSKSSGKSAVSAIHAEAPAHKSPSPEISPPKAVSASAEKPVIEEAATTQISKPEPVSSSPYGDLVRSFR